MKLRLNFDKIACFAVMFASILCLSYSGHLATATQGAWTSNPIVTTSFTPSLESSTDECAMKSRIIVDITGSSNANVCIYSMDGIEIAQRGEGNSRTWLVGLGDDGTMSPFYTGSRGELVYVPHSQYLITFSNVADVMRDGYNFYDVNQLQFDEAEKKYFVPLDATPVISLSPKTLDAFENGFTYSSDGAWVATGLVSSNYGGVARANLKTKQIDTVYQTNVSKTIHWQTNPYLLPSAISNDGQYVTVSGLDASRMVRVGIITGNEQCSASSESCPFIDMTSALEASDVKVASLRPVRAIFSTDGTELELKYNTSSSPTSPLWVLLRMETSAQHIDYLALGDSYSSGEGDVADGDSHYLYGDSQCHVSDRSYPFLLREYWGISSTSMKSVACSGAKVLPDYIGSGSYYGQHNQMLGWDNSRIAETQEAAYDTFMPGIMRQIEFVKRYQPEKITFTGGGNDIGFASILEYCADSYRLFNAVPTDETCAFAADPQMRANLNRSIDDQYSINRLFVEKIREVSPATKIYMVGYPQFIAVGGWSCANSSDILNKTERQMIHDSVSRLNNIIKKVARDTGVYYIDIENSLDGGEICQGSDYMTGPLKMIVSNYSVKKDNNMFHPNAAGHEKIAEAIEQRLATGLDYTILDIPYEHNGVRTVRTAVMPDYSSVGSTRTVTMGPGVFTPNGEVTIDLFSQKINLGTVSTAKDGSLRTDVTFPKDIEGNHLLTLSGLDAKGEPVQLQQFITLTSGIPNDVDGDGILDDDSCNFIIHWHSGGNDVCIPQAGSSDGLTDNTAQTKSSAERSGADPQKRDILEGSLNDQGLLKLSSEKLKNHSDRGIPQIGSKPWSLVLGVIVIISLMISTAYIIKKGV